MTEYSVELTKISIILPGKGARKYRDCTPGNVRIDPVPMESILNSLDFCEWPTLAGEDFHNLFLSVSPEIDFLISFGEEDKRKPGMFSHGDQIAESEYFS